MLLTNRTSVKNTRDLLRAFGGLNETYGYTESYEVQMAQAMVDNITQQLADIVSATRELDADCYAQRIHSYLMFSEPQRSFMQRYNVKRSVMLAALVCAVCYLGAAVQACVRRQRQRMENE